MSEHRENCCCHDCGCGEHHEHHEHHDCGCGHDHGHHRHEHDHEHGCGCGHDHGHEDHGCGCGCGHDHCPQDAGHRKIMLIRIAVCAALWVFFGRWIAIGCFACAAACFAYYRHMAYKNFGGVTGDLAGWFVQITELALAAVIVLGGKLG